tara:strand:+ start:80 stop:442 length:363 start_codon:yes stop_codon:yes gene_type:complete
MATKRELDLIEKLSDKFDQHMEQTSHDQTRMVVMEEKLDKLADAVVSIARAEEKISVLIEDTRDIKTSVDDNTKKIHELELSSSANSADLKTLGKFFWMVAAAATTICAGALSMALGIIN